jgi:hypothetical protein
MKKTDRGIEDQITAGELKAMLEDIPDDTRIFFGCFNLAFYRLKWRGDGLLQIEFNQTVYDDGQGNVLIDN